MTQKDKELLLQDLCARLSYGVICACEKYIGQLKLVCPDGDYCVLQNSPYAIETIKPYLRPMSSITKEEYEEETTLFGWNTGWEHYDWLNAHHFDYRGLIEKGLALEAPDGMY